MLWFTRSSRFTILTIALTVALTLGLAKAQAQFTPSTLPDQLPNQWEFTVPSTSGAPVPTRREGAATRGDDQACIQGNESLTALVPASGTGETAAEYPTFSWYLPQTSASEMEFVLRDAKGNEIYTTQYALAQLAAPASASEPLRTSEAPSASRLGKVNSATENPRVGVASASRIMSLTLPSFASLSPLEVGQDYYWTLALICDSNDRSRDIIAGGSIKRVKPDPALAPRIGQATPEERVALYANAKLWYETLNTLVDLRRDRPTNNNLTQAWDKLLKSVGLDAISKEPGN